MKNITGAKIVIESLIQENVKVIFGYPGEQFYQFMTSYLNKKKSNISW